jgi:hypothetical protein
MLSAPAGGATSPSSAMTRSTPTHRRGPQTSPKPGREPQTISQRAPLRHRFAAVYGKRRNAVFIDTAIGAVAVLFIASPLLFTRNGFAPDFTNDIWLASYQQHTIAAHLFPTLFLQTQHGIFYPLYAFYGGTLFALTGALGELLGGSTIIAFEIMTLAAIAAAYGGLLWLARQLGVRGLLAHAPAVVFLTSAYYVSNLYGRGAWTEFVATSMLPLVIASALRVVRGRWRAAPAVCLLASSIVFSGSHNITLLLGFTTVALALAIYWLLSGRSRELPWRRIAAAGGLIALGVCANAWFLLPDVRYSNDTLISNAIIPWSATAAFNSAGVIFDPLRTVPSSSETPALFVQIPVLALAWGLLAIPFGWRYRRLRAGIVAALTVLVVLLVVIMSAGVYSRLPMLFQEIQFPYRLQTYVSLACAALVLLGILALTRRAQGGGAKSSDRVLAGGLGFVVAFAVALAAWQLWVPNTHIDSYYRSFANRSEVLESAPPVLPASWNAPNNYSDRSLPIVNPKNGITFDPQTLVYNERIAGHGAFPSGTEPFATNIAGGPYFVHVGGEVHVVGRTTEGALVLARAQSGSQPIPFELSAELSGPVTLGRILTAAAVLLTLALAAMTALRHWRRRLSAAA